MAKKSDSFKPTRGMIAEAKRGLEWRKEYNRGGTQVGVSRARDIVNGKALSYKTVKRMKSFFARHEVDKQGKGFDKGEDGYPSAGRIAWALWGGDAGKSWSEAIVKRVEKSESSDMKTTFHAKASISSFTKSDLSDAVSCENQEIAEWAKSVASVFDSAKPEDQPDLLMMRSILVSEGMNLNDDIFLRSELMNARSTGAHKPVNLEHQDENIVGHMLKTYAVNKNGELIEGDSASEPVDIVNEAVIYSYIFPQLARDVEDMASTNDLFVSVEAWFDNYDYAVGGKIVERNENTAPILDEYLRMNGGEGTFRGQKVGRVLRNIRFGGVGIVATPANPESLILEVAETVNPEAKAVENPEAVIASNILGDLDLVQSYHHDEEEKSEGESRVSKQVEDSLKTKLKKHKEKVGDDKRKQTTLRKLKVVYNRGIGAYKTNPGSVRPNVKSPQQWAQARVNSFLYALRNLKFRSGKHDTDLLPKSHPMSGKEDKKSKSGHMNPMYYMDPKTGKFMFPLFKLEWEAKEFDINNGGKGEFHTHTITIDGKEVVFYMPETGHEMGGKEAPEGMKEIMGNYHKKEEKVTNSNDLHAILKVVDNVETMLQSAEASLVDLDSQIVVLGQDSKAYARKQSLASLGLSQDQILNRAERVIAMSDEQFEEYSEDLKDLVKAEENSSEVSSEETVEAVETETPEVEAVETTEKVIEETAEVVEAEQPEATPEVEAVEEVSPEATETVETPEVEEVVSEDNAPEAEAPVVEEVAEEAPVVDETAEVKTVVEEAPVAPPVVEDEVSEEEVAVDLDSIEPVTPEINFPSADQESNTFEKQIHDAIVNIFNQKKKR